MLQTERDVVLAGLQPDTTKISYDITPKEIKVASVLDDPGKKADTSRSITASKHRSFFRRIQFSHEAQVQQNINAENSRRISMGPRTTRAVPSQEPPQRQAGRSKTGAKEEQKDIILDDVDINAAPLSSDEEEESTSTISLASPVSTKLMKRSKFSPPKPISSPLSTFVNKDEFTMPDPLDLDLASSQPSKKRKVASYSKNKNTVHVNIKAESDTGFSIPGGLPETQDFEPDRGFKMPHTALLLDRKHGQNPSKSLPFQPLIQDPLEEYASTGLKFRMPDVLLELDSSATSTEDSLFDVPAPSLEVKPSRSGSVSSLSSLASADMDLSLEQQRQMAHDDSGDGLDGVETTRCRLCNNRMELSVYKEFASRHRKMGTHQQMMLCYDHQKRDAQRTWDKRGYPQIDWNAFENDRIPKHIPHLTEILRRSIPSFYQSKLDSIVQDTKASRKAINNYLKDGILDVAKQGYYGPRGARIIGHAITLSMEKALKGQLLRDKVVRAVGAGAYITSVLVPELMIQLVKEDMGLKDNDEARDVLAESTKVGALLSADDDEVVLRECSEEP